MSLEYFAKEEGMDENNIWGVRQNHPELVVNDLQDELNLTPEQCDFVRYTLMKRGINKWLYNRRQFIDLKHRMKEKVKEAYHGKVSYKQLRKDYEKAYAEMHEICNNPRWIEFGSLHKKMTKCDEEIVIKGKRC
jgi:DNA mismatch repair ATPase MutS